MTTSQRMTLRVHQGDLRYIPNSVEERKDELHILGVCCKITYLLRKSWNCTIKNVCLLKWSSLKWTTTFNLICLPKKRKYGRNSKIIRPCSCHPWVSDSSWVDVRPFTHLPERFCRPCGCSLWAVMAHCGLSPGPQPEYLDLCGRRGNHQYI